MSLIRHSTAHATLLLPAVRHSRAAILLTAPASQRRLRGSLAAPLSLSAVRPSLAAGRVPSSARSFANDASSASRAAPLSPPTPSQAATASSASALGGSVASLGQSLLGRVQGASQIELFHMSHIALLAGIPVALLLSPSVLVAPVDLALGLLLPWHAHVGMVNVTDDYVPRPYRALARGGLLVVSVLATLGLLKINLCGAGITESVKSLWRQPPMQTTSSGQQRQTTVVRSS